VGKAPRVDVYDRYNKPRLHVLQAKRPRSVTALGRYAYARVGASQYAIDLKTGHARSIRADASSAVPMLVAIP
jgi:hypothetical protein